MAVMEGNTAFVDSHLSMDGREHNAMQCIVTLLHREEPQMAVG